LALGGIHAANKQLEEVRDHLKLKELKKDKEYSNEKSRR